MKKLILPYVILVSFWEQIEKSHLAIRCVSMIYENSISRALCAVSDIRHRSCDGGNIGIADIHQDEYWRRRCDQIDSDSDRCLSVYDWSIHSVPCILWLPDLRLNCRRVYSKEKAVPSSRMPEWKDAKSVEKYWG